MPKQYGQKNLTARFKTNWVDCQLTIFLISWEKSERVNDGLSDNGDHGSA